MRLFLAVMSLIFVSPAMADGLFISSTMQSCASNEQCTLVTTQCGQPCGTTPVNTKTISSLEAYYQQQCGQSVEEAGICTNQSNFEAACINNRCTIAQAYQYNASAQDYSSPTAERPVQNQVRQSYAGVNDTDGNFTAYDLPGDEVHKNVMGQYRHLIDIEPASGE